jgi:hypothetical protein
MLVGLHEAAQRTFETGFDMTGLRELPVFLL